MSDKKKRVSLDTFFETENMEIEHGSGLLVVSMTEGLQFFDAKSLARREIFQWSRTRLCEMVPLSSPTRIC